MLKLDFPDLAIAHLVLDFNGTLARDGELLVGVGPRLKELANELQIHVVTGDTFGRAQEALHGLPCHVHVLAPTQQAKARVIAITRSSS